MWTRTIAAMMAAALISSPAYAYTVRQTKVVLAAGTSTVIVAPSISRRMLGWMNVGANPMTVVPTLDAPAVAGSGFNFDPGSSTANEGGSLLLEGPGGAGATNGFTAISTGGTTVIIWEGQ